MQTTQQQSSQQSKPTFTNTKNNRTMRDFLYAILALMAVETILALAAAQALIDNKGIFYPVAAALLALDGYALFHLLPLLSSSHRLEERGLSLRLGRRFHLFLPWEKIQSLKPADSLKSPKKEALGICCARRDEALYCLGGENNIYHLRLKEPLPVKAPDANNRRSKKGFVTEIFFNADDDSMLAKTAKRLPREINTLKEEQAQRPSLFTPGTLSQSTDAPILAIRELSYRYGSYPAVDSLSLTVPGGEVFAFLGPNGAGKSTTLKMMTGLLKPQQGQILLRGKDIWAKENAKIRRNIGYVPDQPILYSRLTAKEHLYYSGRLAGLAEDTVVQRSQALLETFDLTPFQDHMIQTFSQGMQRKVSFALALLAEPELLIVDELTNAFDAMTLAKIKGIFKEWKKAGRTVFFSGHVMAVAEEVSDRIAVLHKGKLLACGSMEELCQAYGKKVTLEELFLAVTGEGQQ